MTAKDLRSHVWNRVYEETTTINHRDNRVFIEVNERNHPINRDV